MVGKVDEFIKRITNAKRSRELMTEDAKVQEAGLPSKRKNLVRPKKSVCFMEKPKI